MLTDYHLHTTFSADGHQTPMALAARAEALGVRYLAVTDHVDATPYTPGYDFDIQHPEAYGKAIDEMRAAYPRLTIQKGLEVGYDPEYWDRVMKRLWEVKPDYVLASLHYVRHEDPYHEDYFKHRTRQEAYDNYLEAMLTALEPMSKIANTLAHLDYCSKMAPYPDPELKYEDHAKLLEPILQKVIASDMALEINTSAYRMRPAPMPGASVLARYYKLGGRKIIFGSDGHYEQYVALEMERAHQLARDIGFTRHSIFVNGQERQFSL